MQSKRILSTLMLLGLLTWFTGCPQQGSGSRRGASGEQAQSDVWSSARRGSGDVLSAADFESDLHGRVSVAPDRALVRVRGLVMNTDRMATSADAASLGEALVAEIAEQGVCEARVVDHATVSFSGSEDWHGSVSVRVDALLTGLEDVDARAERLEHCLARIDAAADRREDGVVRRGAPLLTVDQPEAYRAELLTRAFRDLRAVAATTDTPPQFTAEATRCTSAGHVVIRSRSLTGIVLGVDFSCQPSFAPAMPAPTLERPTRELDSL
ncbi:MAG: hypothetical protein GXP55_00095 [Deltaproteobacteria bacterium]|nr:hypothetical protein [Deltaproteobacteria bacterium]